ncbi:hypothetical protein KKD70_05350, partial [Patescibacteria group bacterium]|nr:hypothetical protein [Patescibacteria group bacterium]
DYTIVRPGSENISIESVQMQNEGHAFLQSDVLSADYLNFQQCVYDGTSSASISGLTNYQPRFNRDHGPNITAVCRMTPDPPHTQYLNNSATGAQSGQTGNEGSPASVYDLTPVFSAIHNDGEIDDSPGNNEDTDSIVNYQIYAATSAQDLFDDTTIGCINPISNYFTTPSADDTRISDITTNCALSPNETYYWKVRFKDDDDGNTGTTNDQGWGLWSATQTFETDEGGSIVIGN